MPEDSVGKLLEAQLVERQLAAVRTHLWEHSGVLVTRDRDGSIIYASPMVETIFGYQRRNDLVGRQVEELLEPDARAKHIALRQQFYKNPQQGVMGGRTDLKGLRRNGETFPVLIEAHSLREAGEDITYVLIIDMTRKAQQGCPVHHHTENPAP